MDRSEILSILAVTISGTGVVLAVIKAIRDERRARQADRRLDELEARQKTEDERRVRVEAPFFVPLKLWGGTTDDQGQAILRLVVRNEGRSCLFVEPIESDFSLNSKHVRNGAEIEISYRAGMFEKGHKTQLSLKYETSEGHSGVHKYIIGVGEVFLKRTEPCNA